MTYLLITLVYGCIVLLELIASRREELTLNLIMDSLCYIGLMYLNYLVIP